RPFLGDFVGQGQRRAAWAWRDIDPNLGPFTFLGPGSAEQESKPARPVDFEELAVMLGVAVLTAVDDEKAAADAGVDGAADDLAVRGGEQEIPGLRGVEPGVEQPFRRRGDVARDGDDSVG